MRLAGRVDSWMFATGEARRLAALRVGLATIIGLRVATWPFVELAGTPRAMFRPPLFLRWTGGFPPAGLFVALQVAGVVGVVLTVAGTRSGSRVAVVGLRVAWLSLLVLAGYKTSSGKILHNDVLLLLAAVPAVLCPVPARFDDARTGGAFGWPLRGGLTVLAAVYCLCGLQKLRHSGLAWVFSDNMQWILGEGARSGRAPTSIVALALGGSRGASIVAAAGLLTLELAFPLVLFERRARVPMAVGAVILHTMTWLTLGLDYWSWSLVAALVLLLNTAPVSRSPCLRA